MKRILVIDDSHVVRSFHTNILKTAGFRTDGAADGVEALEMSLSKQYDLILSDINMPNMDGLTFIRRYRAGNAHHYPLHAGGGRSQTKGL